MAMGEHAAPHLAPDEEWLESVRRADEKKFDDIDRDNMLEVASQLINHWRGARGHAERVELAWRSDEWQGNYAAFLRECAKERELQKYVDEQNSTPTVRSTVREST